MTPTQRTLERLRREGWTAQVVEKHAPRPAGQVFHNGRRKSVFTLETRIDLFGCIDIIAIRDGEIMGVQATGGSENHAKRLAKIRAEPRMRTWITAAKLQIWTWRKVATKRKDGSKGAPRWEPRVEEVTLELLDGER